MDVTWLSDLAVFAADQAENGGRSFGWLSILTLWAPIILLFYLLLIRPQQRQHAKRQAMLAKVKKNDRVIAAGGIHGVVTNVRPEADEVTMKVDETTNTKLRVTLSSIVHVVGGEASDEKGPSK